jgi:bifunctional oligoribonuclease and PAP phosphatase NrnA
MLPKSEPTAAQKAALDLLLEGRRFLLTGHVRPDGDCIGAEAALASLLAALDKDVWIINPDPAEPQFDYLAREFHYGSYDGGDLPQHDVAVLLDCSELSRCGRLADAIEGVASQKLVIDHHIHHGGAWWDQAYVDTTASATGLLIHRIARQLGVELDKPGAEGVFTSIVTDTGWFKYSNTDAETLSVAGDLVARGVDPDALYRAIYQRKRRSHPLETGKVLASTEYFADDRLAVVCLPRENGKASAALEGDDILDLLRSVQSVEVVLSLRELASGEVKLSARSKTDYNVNALAREFGGGGHRKASGATIEGALDEVKSRLVEAATRGFESSGSITTERA